MTSPNAPNTADPAPKDAAASLPVRGPEQQQGGAAAAAAAAAPPPAPPAGGMQSRVSLHSTTVSRHEAEMLEHGVELFYKKVMADPALEPFFAAIDMQRQRMKLVNFMIYVLGGAEVYAGRDIFKVHKHMVERQGLCNTHFDLVMKYMGETLHEMDQPPDVITNAMAVIESTRPLFHFRPGNEARPKALAAAGGEASHDSSGAAGGKGEGLAGGLKGLSLEEERSSCGEGSRIPAVRPAPPATADMAAGPGGDEAHPAAVEYVGRGWAKSDSYKK